MCGGGQARGSISYELSDLEKERVEGLDMVSGKAGRWADNPYLSAEELAAHAPAYDWDSVQEQLVEAFVLWRRSPGGGAWPFASDGPWHLIQRSGHLGDYDARGGDLDAEVEPRPLPLTRAEVEQRDRVTAWLDYIPDADDRRLVGMALKALASGQKQVPWKRLLKPMGVKRGYDGLRKRYERAIGAICSALNASTF